MSTSTPDLLDSMTTAWSDAVKRWTEGSQAAWDAWVPQGWTAAAPGATARRHPHDHHDDEHHHDHECGCGCRDDVCACCVPDADVLLRARAGERRVVPFVLHNRWRRERAVTLDVGPWHTCSGEGLVVAAEFEDAELTLAPCEDRVVRLLVTVRVDGPEGKRTRAGDLAECASAYADLRFEGCARPQRLGVVVRPGACEAVEVSCDCGCC
ncbi:hypothetical protein [Phycicoccus sp.]|uniref:hypothetical protein n=1 Tax=Phycicoccus sp. TaxID=1902410 RepID=UPI002CFE9B50|nr:hypothetical protein [Phycicoccus sp.]HMM96813.1 hypothetical protein [Phycicoccus sp.]